jgi:hypothetical protein
VTEAVNPTYEDIQQKATGPGVEEWKRADRARADLSEFCRQLQDAPRISDLARSERAWERYEAVRAQVEEMSVKARDLNAGSRESCAVVDIARDNGVDIDRIVDEHRKDYHRKARGCTERHNARAAHQQVREQASVPSS